MAEQPVWLENGLDAVKDADHHGRRREKHHRTDRVASSVALNSDHHKWNEKWSGVTHSQCGRHTTLSLPGKFAATFANYVDNLCWLLCMLCRMLKALF